MCTDRRRIRELKAKKESEQKEAKERAEEEERAAYKRKMAELQSEAAWHGMDNKAHRQPTQAAMHSACHIIYVLVCCAVQRNTAQPTLTSRMTGIRGKEEGDGH